MYFRPGFAAIQAGKLGAKRMAERNKVLTTFQAADYCHVSPFTIRNWIESGSLPAYKTPGGHRRVLKRDLDDFLKKHGMPGAEEISSLAKKVLVVDDDKIVAEFVRKVIGQLDGEVEVAVAPDGYEAGALVTSFSPSVVVLDLRMPGLDGFQVCEKIKRDPATAKTTVIGITGYYSPEYEAKFKGCGGLKLLKKPLDVETLIETIEEALAGVEEAKRR
jgi:excisionase family DNA binding protein